MTRLKDKVAFITGAGSGIGRATALRFAQEGAVVAVNDISGAGAEATVSLVAKAGGRALACVSDVSNVAATQAAVAAAEREFGRIDILVNNAGTDGRLLQDGRSDGGSVRAHLPGPRARHLLHYAGGAGRNEGAPLRQDRQCVVDLRVTVGNPMQNAYNAAKGAIAALTKGWAKELASYGILVNAIAPGPTITPMTTNRLSPEYFAERAKQIPLGRWGTAEDMAAAITFLASPDADYITGQIISPNGGLVIT